MDRDSILKVIEEYNLKEQESSELRSELKKIKEETCVLKEQIIEYMQMKDIDSFGKFKLIKTKPNKKVNKDVVSDVLKEQINDRNKIVHIIDQLYNNDAEDEVVKLVSTKRK